MTKSMSMPCNVTSLLPDPFPELSQHKMRLYHFQEIERTGDQSSTSELSDTGQASPSTVLSIAGDDMSVAETSSTTDTITQVLPVFAFRIACLSVS